MSVHCTLYSVQYIESEVVVVSVYLLIPNYKHTHGPPTTL